MQIAMLIFLTIVSSAILYMPAITAERAKQSAWIASMVASLAGFVSLWVIVKLGQRFPQHTLPQYSEIILGKILGKFVGGLYVLYFLVVNILVIRQFSDFLTVTSMPETPGLIFNALIVLIGAYAASKGIEVIARMTQFVLPLFVFTLVFLFALATPNVELGMLQPFLEGGIQPILWGSVVPASWYGEIVVLAILLPMVNRTQEVKRKGALALLAAMIFLTADTLVTLTIFGPNLTGDLLFPFWYLAKYIEIGNYLQRVESLLVYLWMTGIVIKVAVFHYLICLTTTQVLNLKKYKLLSYGVVIVQIMGATFLFKNTSQLSEFLSQNWPPFGLIFEVGLPVILLAIAVIRRRKARE